MSKRINTEALKHLGKGADVIEAEMEVKSPPRRARMKERKVYRSFSLSLVESDYFKFLDYLDNHNISSGSEFLRNLLKENGVI